MRPIDADALLNLPFERMIHTDFGDTAIPIEEIEMAPTVNFSLNLDNISDEQIQKFKTIWQRANSKGLLAINEDRQSGHWILEGEDCDNGGNNIYQCSKCFYRDTHSNTAIVPYCWHCGAYMLSEESGQEVPNGES